MIYIHKGDDTVFANISKFLTFYLETELNLQGWSAKFTLQNITKTIENIEGKKFDVILTNQETATLRIGDCFGSVILTDNKGKIKTITNSIEFKITNEVVENVNDIIELNIPLSSEIKLSYKINGEILENYNLLKNKPQINGVELIGNKTTSDLGLQKVGDYALKNEVNKKCENAYSKALKEANEYTLNELKRPQHNTMIVTAMTEGFGFKADENATNIKRHADGGGAVILRFNAPDGTGEQSYPYETFKDNYAIFRRAFIDKANDVTSRIIIKIDNNYNVIKEEEKINVATKEEIQDLEDNKANYTLKVIASDKLTQLEALEILNFYDQYDGKLIEFITNGDLPNKTVATGRVFTDKNGNQYLATYNIDGTTSIWNRDYFEKHNFECRSLINQMIDLDNLTIDIRGEAPYIASVQNAINKPSNTSAFGIIQILAYNITNQLQIYRDITTAKEYFRTVTGEADRHSFSQWNAILPIDENMSDNSTNCVQNKVIKKYIDEKIAELRNLIK